MAISIFSHQSVYTLIYDKSLMQIEVNNKQMNIILTKGKSRVCDKLWRLSKVAVI